MMLIVTHFVALTLGAVIGVITICLCQVSRGGCFEQDTGCNTNSFDERDLDEPL